MKYVRAHKWRRQILVRTERYGENSRIATTCVAIHLKIQGIILPDKFLGSEARECCRNKAQACPQGS